ncbi:MAG: DUF4395 family protein [Proteobacteria bacterium]|nr:DUF4395 family protein [Pseudomonadota bacterium]
MDTDRELQFGPGMRVQRLAEASFLVAALFTQDVRLALVTFTLTMLQALSPRWVPIALVVASIVRFSGQHHVGDLYFDLRGIRGACVISVVVQGLGLALVATGYPRVGFIILTVPTASFLMAPTLGFCAGCWFYVLGRDWMASRGWLRRASDELRDVTVDEEGSGHQPQLPAAAQR